MLNYITRLFLLYLLTLSRVAFTQTAGQLDMSFNPGTGANESIWVITLQTDEKILIAGNFTSYNGTPRNYIARLNTDGSLDTSFDPGTGGNNSVRSVSVQNDGKIIIGGSFTTFNGTARNHIARLNSDGSLDESFDPGSGANSFVSSTALQSDGKIIIEGGFSAYNGTSRNYIARVNADGSLDTSFDPGTGANDFIFTTKLQSDGKIIIGGSFTSFNGVNANRIARLNTDGSLDNSFDPGTGVEAVILTCTLQSDGKIIIGGGFTSFNGTARNRIARLNTDGSLDVSFDPGIGADYPLRTIAVQNNEKIIIGGQFSSYNETDRNHVARLNADGSLDESFDPGTGANAIIYIITTQPDGKIIMGGDFSSYNETPINHIARLFPTTLANITAFSPLSGPVGTSITITGTGFNTTPANNIVIFGATAATVTNATATELTVTVPAGATYAPITVLDVTTGLLTYSTYRFTPTFTPNKGDITTADFEAKVDFTTGTNPQSVAIGDLDGDGMADLAVVNQTSQTVSVFRNTSSSGNISYAEKKDFTTGLSPFSIAIGDLDGDGKADLAVTNRDDNTVSVFRNTGSPGNIDYADKQDFTTGSQPRFVAIGDLDGDGKADLAVANVGGNTVSVFHNTGSPGSISYADKEDFTTGSQPYSIAVGDLDGDGMADLAVANLNSNTVSVFLNTGSSGSISYAAKEDFETGSIPQSVAIGDLDGDGLADLAVTNIGSNTVSVFRNTGSSGSINFAAKEDFATGSNPNSVAIGDLDGDGMADLAVANSSSSSVSVLRNTGSSGSINYATKVDFTTGSQPQSVAIGDLDGDGKADLAVITNNNNTVAVFRNNPVLPPTITSFTPISGPVGTSITIIGSNFDPVQSNNIVFFGAARADVTASSETELSVIVPAGATFQPITVYANGLQAFSKQPFIVTFPGQPDIVSGTFAAKTDFATGNLNQSVTAGDLDGDGKADLVVSLQEDHNIGIFRNTSSGVGNINFAARQDFSIGDFTSPNVVALADFDGDGKLDVVVSKQFDNGVSVFLNTSSGPGNVSLGTKQDFTAGANPYWVATGDFDGDGKPDIVVANALGNSVSVLLNTSTGSGNISFAAKVDFTTGDEPRHVTVGDIDGDGKPDLAVSCTEGNVVSVLRNISPTVGTVSFATKIDFSVNQAYSAAIGDLNGNGNADLAVISYFPNEISVFRYNGTGPGNISYAAKVVFPSSNNAVNIAIADMDGDGKLDLAVANQSFLSVAVLRNTNAGTSAISFADKVDFATAENPSAISIVDLDGDGKNDMAVSSQFGFMSVLRNQGDVTAPVITSLLPLDDAIDVPADTDLVITFNEPIQKGIGNILIREEGDITQTIDVTESSVSIDEATVTIEPSAFTPNANVNIEFAPGVFKDLNDNDHGGIADPTVWNFTILTGTSENTAELDTSIDFGSGANGPILSLDFQTDGKMLVAGDFTEFAGNVSNRLERLLATGEVDLATFNPGSGANDWVRSVIALPDGKILAAGDFTSFNTIPVNFLLRLDADGSIDDTFNQNPGPDDWVRSMSRQSDGKIIIAGDFTLYDGIATNYIDRINSDGTLDLAEFNPGAGADNFIFATALQADEKILICGIFTTYDGTSRNGIARLNTDGSLDTGFDPGAGANAAVYSITVQSDGKIIITGEFTTFDGISRNGVARLNADGTLDTGFNPGTGASALVFASTVQSDGKIILGGAFGLFNGLSRNGIVRLNSDGSVDTSFDPQAGFNDYVSYLRWENDMVWATGAFTSYRGTPRGGIARIFAPAEVPLAAEPTAQPSNLSFTDITSTSFTVNFDAASPTADGYIAIRRAGAAPTADPADATSYSVGETIGDGIVAFAGSATTFNETGLTANTTYHYKIYSFNGNNNSINYLQTSPLTGSQATADDGSLASEPTAQPTNLSFNNISTIAFNVNFAPASPAADGYIAIRRAGAAPTVDPSDAEVYTIGVIIGDGEVVFVGSGTSFNETGLTESTTYHYKIYSFNGSASTTNYLQTSPLTGSQSTSAAGGDTTPPVFSNNTTPAAVNAGSPVNVSVDINDPESGVSDALISFGPANSATFSTQDQDMTNTSGNTWTFTIPATAQSELGVRYQITAINAEGLDASIGPFVVGLNQTGSGLSIPFNSFGSELSNYRIIAVPLNLQNKTVNGIFGDALGTYGDRSKWRMYHWSSGQTQELNGSSQLNQGRGYWLIAKESANLSTGAGQTTGSIENPFSISLTNGWNQIGNPYNFNLLWSDVVAANSGVGITELKIYNGSFDNGTRLDAFQGGFIFVNSGNTLVFPASKNPSVNGRFDNSEAEEPVRNNSIDGNDWEVRFSLSSGEMFNNLSGLGMHPEAQEAFDQFDDFTLPRFIEYLELSHDKVLHRTKYSRDIVPAAEKNTWSFEVNTSNENQSAELSWDNSYFNNTQKQLVLWDEQLKRSIDMSQMNSYSFIAPAKFKVYYGDAAFIKEQILQHELILHDPYPNPASGLINFSFVIPENFNETEISLELFDQTGSRVAIPATGVFQAGFHQVSWNMADEGRTIANGLYLIRLKTHRHSLYKKILILRQ